MEYERRQQEVEAERGNIVFITEEDLAAFYTAHDPEKVPLVARIIAKHSTQHLLELCNNNYGAQPKTRPKDEMTKELQDKRAKASEAEAAAVLQEDFDFEARYASAAAEADTATSVATSACWVRSERIEFPELTEQNLKRGEAELGYAPITSKGVACSPSGEVVLTVQYNRA
jgi:hypothetical protein